MAHGECEFGNKPAIKVILNGCYHTNNIILMAKKWAKKRITVNMTNAEANILEDISNRTERSYTEIIRELIRNLKVDEN